MKKINIVSTAAALAMIASVAMIVPAFAQTSAVVSVAPVTVGGGGAVHPWPARPMAMAGIFGTVSAMNGTTLTVVAGSMRMRPMPERPGTVASGTPGSMMGSMATTTYTVDASNATIYKGTATTTIESVAVGDTVVVQGKTTGTNIVATIIRDGAVMPNPGGPMKPVMPGYGEGHGMNSSSTSAPVIQGNGEPVVGGSVTAILGTTLTVTNPSNVTYTISAGSATIVKNGTSTAFSNIVVGDNVVVQGVVNGTSITASSVIDQGMKGAGASGTSTVGINVGAKMGFGGIFGAIGGFFQHLFGF
jgi:hypothetical protein